MVAGRRHLVVVVAALVLAGVLGVAHAHFQADELIKADNILAHLQALEDIANLEKNKGSRAVYLGYNDSVEYVKAQLQATPFTVTEQHLEVTIPEYAQGPYLALARPDEVTFRQNTDYLGYNAGGSGDVNAPIQQVQGGCSPADFADFVPGRIALVNRGSFAPSGSNVTVCSYRAKVTNANNAGAVGVLVYNPDDQLPTLGGADPGVSVPVFGISSAVATFILEYGTDAVVHMQAQVVNRVFVTKNVIAETTAGRSDRIIVIGSHLDSVPAGPGINDNGSGSATNLEIALQFARIGFNPVNKVRFAWWAAEEWGLLGAYHYVSQLSEADKANHALNLNFDMVGSPNFIRGVYDGRNGPENVRKGSGNIQTVFEEYFNEQGLTHEPTPFNGRSDYGPFIENGIPAGGLAAGAEEIKTVEQQARFGGSAFVALDSCYHRACDSISNINREAIQSLGSAAAHVLWTLAMEPDLRGFLSQ